MSNIKMYRVGMMFRNRTGLKLVDVERITDKCVWVDGRRENKRSETSAYFHSFDDAKEFALNRATNNLKQAQSRLDDAQADQNRIETLTADTARVRYNADRL